MKLYKFRQYGSDEDRNRVHRIINTGEFYLADRKRLNDPMEGFFEYYSEEDRQYSQRVKDFLLAKRDLRICSFSNTYHPILLWSHYADGHKGIAIEITLNSKHYQDLYRIKYVKKIPFIDFKKDNQNPISVLRTKIKFWRYEREFRYIDFQDGVRLGEITGIYFGIRTPSHHKNQLRVIANRNGIPTFETRMDFNTNEIEALR
jgi:hypothetical protein